jgi:shikimate kinase
VKKHLLLIGFSCTGKTSLGGLAFPNANVIDSDREILRWIERTRQKKYDHLYEVYMGSGREQAISMIKQAEEALIADWADDEGPKIISIGPGFPLRQNWSRLRAVSNVVLFRRSAQGIYESLKGRREEIFKQRPDAKLHDNWDVGVMVDERRVEYTPQVAVTRIVGLLAEREPSYKDCDEEVNTDDREQAKIQLLAIWKKIFA